MLEHKGYIEIPIKIDRNLFRKLYILFEDFLAISEQQGNNNFVWEIIDQDDKVSYCKKSFGLTHGIENNGIKFVHFDFCKYFFRKLNQFYSGKIVPLIEKLHIIKLIKLLSEIQTKMDNMILTLIKENLPIIPLEIFYSKGKTYSLIRLIKMFDLNNNHFCKPPHIDRSGITLALDSSDLHRNSLLVCTHEDFYQYNYSSLQPIKFNYLSENNSSAILLPGLLLSKKVPHIKATPHGVQGGHGKNRYSILYALQVPGVSLDKNDTCWL